MTHLIFSKLKRIIIIRKLEKIFKEGDKVSKYDFDLHKHLKENKERRKK